MSGERRSVDNYLAALLGRIAPLPPETIRLDDALGRVASEDVRASLPVPRFDNSAMDGFAVGSSDVCGTSPDRPVSLRIVSRLRAGVPDSASVGAGEAARIMTGARIPSGADRVVPVEATSLSNSAIGTRSNCGNRRSQTSD